MGDTAQQVQSAGVAHDLTGRIFQRLIADRKYLATFYTRPEYAALLARLAMAKLQTPGSGIDWADAGAIGKLRIGDFACGTGALLSAVYEQVAARHQRAGGDLAALHPVMMEEVLHGCDVMPSAAHITSATLSGVQPDITFNKSRIYTMPYGRQSDGTVSIGSLELLQPSQVLTMFNTNDPALRTGSVGEETAAQVNVDIPDGTFDIVVVNPPFTRATNHEGGHADVVNPAVAAFSSTEADQGATQTESKVKCAEAWGKLVVNLVGLSWIQAGVGDGRKRYRQGSPAVGYGCQRIAPAADSGSDAPGALARPAAVGPRLDRRGHGRGSGTGPSHHRPVGRRLRRGRTGGLDVRAVRGLPRSRRGRAGELRAAVQELHDAVGIGPANWNRGAVRTSVEGRMQAGKRPFSDGAPLSLESPAPGSGYRSTSLSGTSSGSRRWGRCPPWS